MPVIGRAYAGAEDAAYPFRGPNRDLQKDVVWVRLEEVSDSAVALGAA
jgi:hypothetical protein